MQFIPENACEICGTEDGQRLQCVMCGAYVCKECFVKSHSLCLNCEEAKCALCGEFLASRACNICGRLVCEDHSTKKDESTICDECRMIE